MFHRLTATFDDIYSMYCRWHLHTTNSSHSYTQSHTRVYDSIHWQHESNVIPLDISYARNWHHMWICHIFSFPLRSFSPLWYPLRSLGVCVWWWHTYGQCKNCFNVWEWLHEFLAHTHTRQPHSIQIMFMNDVDTAEAATDYTVRAQNHNTWIKRWNEKQTPRIKYTNRVVYRVN